MVGKGRKKISTYPETLLILILLFKINIIYNEIKCVSEKERSIKQRLWINRREFQRLTKKRFSSIMIEISR